MQIRRRRDVNRYKLSEEEPLNYFDKNIISSKRNNESRMLLYCYKIINVDRLCTYIILLSLGMLLLHRLDELDSHIPHVSGSTMEESLNGRPLAVQMDNDTTIHYFEQLKQTNSKNNEFQDYDETSLCEEWSYYSFQCEKDPEYMWKRCKNTCKEYYEFLVFANKKQTISLEDVLGDENCERLLAEVNNACKSDHIFMMQECRKSCIESYDETWLLDDKPELQNKNMGDEIERHSEEQFDEIEKSDIIDTEAYYQEVKETVEDVNHVEIENAASAEIEDHDGEKEKSLQEGDHHEIENSTSTKTEDHDRENEKILQEEYYHESEAPTNAQNHNKEKGYYDYDEHSIEEDIYEDVDVDDFITYSDDVLKAYFAFDDDSVRHPQCRRTASHRHHKPSCNMFHELPLVDSGYFYLSSGSYRDAFYSTNQQDDSVLKLGSFKYQNYNDELMEMIRVDAMVIDFMSNSDRIVQIYGHCGTSVSVPYINGPSSYILENSDLKIDPTTKLKIALRMAKSIAELHGWMDGPIVHGDIQFVQWLLDENGDVILSDFNRAEKLLWDDERQQFCKFYTGGGVGNVRSPEEFKSELLNEKIDVYSFGLVLYTLLTSKEPYWSDGLSDEQLKEEVINGVTPIVDKSIRDNSFAENAIASVMDKCLEMDSDLRIDIFGVVSLLDAALLTIGSNVNFDLKDFIQYKQDHFEQYENETTADYYDYSDEEESKEEINSQSTTSIYEELRRRQL